MMSGTVDSDPVYGLTASGCLARAAFGRLAPAGASARLVILIFHRVLRTDDPLLPDVPTAEMFERQLRWVRDWFNVLSLDEAVRRLRARTLPARPLAITFDDGYADNVDVALPVLNRLGLSATFFIATGFLDGGRMFNDSVIEALRQARGDVLDLSDIGLGAHPIGSNEARCAAIAALLDRVKYLPQHERDDTVVAIAERCGATLPDDLMMCSEQVAALHRAGMAIGGHTVSHPILRTLRPDAARREIAAGRARLEEITGDRIALFAYPNGRPGRDYGPEHAAMACEAGFDAAVSTAWGAARAGADPYQLPRFTPWDRERWRYGLRLLRTIAQPQYAAA